MNQPKPQAPLAPPNPKDIAARMLRDGALDKSPAEAQQLQIKRLEVQRSAFEFGKYALCASGIVGVLITMSLANPNAQLARTLEQNTEAMRAMSDNYRSIVEDVSDRQDTQVGLVNIRLPEQKQEPQVAAYPVPLPQQPAQPMPVAYDPNLQEWIQYWAQNPDMRWQGQVDCSGKGWAGNDCTALSHVLNGG